MRRAILGALAIALISLAEARQLGLLPATRQEDAYSLQFPNLFGGGGNPFARSGGGTTIPFWRLPPLWRQSIYSPRFGLGPLALGLGLSTPTGAISAPGAVPVGRPRPAAVPEMPEARAGRLAQQVRAGTLPQAGGNLISLEEAVQRGFLPASALPLRRPVAPPPVARQVAPLAPPAPARAPAPTVSDAAQVQAALQAAGGVAKLGGQVAEAVAPTAPEPGFLSTLTPEEQRALAEQRAGERASGGLATSSGPVPATLIPLDPATGLPGGFNLSIDPATGRAVPVGGFGLPAPAWSLPIDPTTGLPGGGNLIVDPVTGVPRFVGEPPPAIDPATGLPLSSEGTDIIPAAWHPPEGRAVGTGPIASPTSAQRATTVPATTAPSGPSWFTSLASSAAPALNIAVPALSAGAGAYQISQGNPAGAVPLGLGSLQLEEAIRSGKAPLSAPGPYNLNLAASGLQGAGLISGLVGGPPELGLGLSTAGTLAAGLPYLIPGTAANAALLTALGSTAGVGAGAGAGATAGGAVAGGTGAAGAAAGGGGILAGAGAALGAIAPVLAMYAIGTTLGGIREANIEKGYQMKAKQAASDFSANSDVLATGQNIARFRAGDTSVLPSLQSSLRQAVRTGQAFMQPRGGSSAAMDKYIRGIYGAVIGTPAFGPTVISTAKAVDPNGPWDQDYETQVTYAYDALNAFGIGSPAFYGPPPGYRGSNPTGERPQPGGKYGAARAALAAAPPPVGTSQTAAPQPGGKGGWSPQAQAAAALAAMAPSETATPQPGGKGRR